MSEESPRAEVTGRPQALSDDTNTALSAAVSDIHNDIQEAVDNQTSGNVASVADLSGLGISDPPPSGEVEQSATRSNELLAVSKRE